MSICAICARICWRPLSVSICAICARICWRPLCLLCQSAPSVPESAGGLWSAVWPCQSAPSAPESAGGLCVCVCVNLRHLRQNLLAASVLCVNLRHLRQNLLAASVCLRLCQSAPSAPESAGGLCASASASICAICARICWRPLCSVSICAICARICWRPLLRLCQSAPSVPESAGGLCLRPRQSAPSVPESAGGLCWSVSICAICARICWRPLCLHSCLRLRLSKPAAIHLTRQQLADRPEKTTRAADAARRGSTHTIGSNLPASDPMTSIGAHPYGHHLKPFRQPHRRPA